MTLEEFKQENRHELKDGFIELHETEFDDYCKEQYNAEEPYPARPL